MRRRTILSTWTSSGGNPGPAEFEAFARSRTCCDANSSAT